VIRRRVSGAGSAKPGGSKHANVAMQSAAQVPFPRAGAPPTTSGVNDGYIQTN
jgi:hypothetical protein